MKYQEMTQQYSTFGDKLLQHTDVLYSIQHDKKFKPITVQLVPTNVCDLACDYCSVKNRDKRAEMDFTDILIGLTKFRHLGAKALEITGGGNPLLYPKINEVIEEASNLGYEIGIITNSVIPDKYLTDDSIEKLKWIRVSLSALDKQHVDVNFDSISYDKLSFSYIMNDKTTPEILERISSLATQYNVKFVRLAPDCLGDDSLTIHQRWDSVLEKLNNPKIFIKEIGENYFPHSHCYVGLVRPYWCPEGIFICSSHVLATQKLEMEFKLCDVENIEEFYEQCNENLKKGVTPYPIDISRNCFHCYYYNNNKILHTVCTEMEDKNFA